MSTRNAVLLVAALSAVAGLAVLPRPASALLTDRQLAAASPHVVVAVVEDARSRRDERGPLIVTDYGLRIEERLKGDAPDRITLTQPGGTVGGETQGCSLAAPLAVGGRYLLFLQDLDRPLLAPVTGGPEGAFPLERHPDPEALVAAAREVIARVEASPEPADSAWLPEPAPALPAKEYRPLGAADKFVVRNPAVATIEVNPLPAGSGYAEAAEEAMAKWNRYAKKLFRVSPNPSSTWAYGNGRFDVAGFPTEAEMQAQFGRGWGGGTSAVFWRQSNGHVTEADMAFNPAFPWSLEPVDTADGPRPFRDAVLSSLGTAWGYQGQFDLLNGPLFPQVSRDSALNGRPNPYRQAVLEGEDGAAVRATYPGTQVRDGAISSYRVSNGLFFPLYMPARPTAAAVRAGGSFAFQSAIKVENPGSVPLAKPSIDVYLVPRRFSLDGAVRLKRIGFRPTVPPGGALDLALGTVAVPRKVKAGTYFFAFVLRDAADAYQDNNVAWSNADVTLTVQ